MGMWCFGRRCSRRMGGARLGEYRPLRSLDPGLTLHRVVVDGKPKKQKPRAGEPIGMDYPVDVLAGVDEIVQQCTRYYQQLTALSQLEDPSLVCKSVKHPPQVFG